MSNITISELRPNESFLTELESDVLTASIVGGGERKRRKRGKRRRFKKAVRNFFKKIKYSVIFAGIFKNSFNNTKIIIKYR